MHKSLTTALTLAILACSLVTPAPALAYDHSIVYIEAKGLSEVQPTNASAAPGIYDRSDYELWTVLELDLTSLPAGRTIDDCAIVLPYDYCSIDNPVADINVWTITASFDYDTCTWNNPPTEATKIQDVDIQDVDMDDDNRLELYTVGLNNFIQAEYDDDDVAYILVRMQVPRTSDYIDISLEDSTEETPPYLDINWLDYSPTAPTSQPVLDLTSQVDNTTTYDLTATITDDGGGELVLGWQHRVFLDSTQQWGEPVTEWDNGLTDPDETDWKSDTDTTTYSHTYAAHEDYLYWQWRAIGISNWNNHVMWDNDPWLTLSEWSDAIDENGDVQDIHDTDITVLVSTPLATSEGLFLTGRSLYAGEHTATIEAGFLVEVYNTGTSTWEPLPGNPYVAEIGVDNKEVFRAMFVEYGPPIPAGWTVDTDFRYQAYMAYGGTWPEGAADEYGESVVYGPFNPWALTGTESGLATIVELIGLDLDSMGGFMDTTAGTIADTIPGGMWWPCLLLMAGMFYLTRNNGTLRVVLPLVVLGVFIAAGWLDTWLIIVLALAGGAILARTIQQRGGIG